MSPVSFVQPGEWVLALRSVPASSETPLGSKDVADGGRAHRSSSCELLPDGGWAEGHSSEALLCLRRIQFPSFHNVRTYFFLKFPLSSICCYPPSSPVTPPRPGSPGIGDGHRAVSSAHSAHSSGSRPDGCPLPTLLRLRCCP